MLHKQNMSCFLTCLQKLGHSAIRVNVIILRLPFPCHDSVVFFSAARSAPPSHACCRYTTHPPAVLPWVCTCSHQLSPLYTKTTTTKFNHYCDALIILISIYIKESKKDRSWIILTQNISFLIHRCNLFHRLLNRINLWWTSISFLTCISLQLAFT